MTGPNIAAFYGGYAVSSEGEVARPAGLTRRCWSATEPARMASCSGTAGGFDPVNFLRGNGTLIPVGDVGLLRGVTLAAFSFSFLVCGAGRRPTPGSDPLRGRFDGVLSGKFS